MPIKTTSDAITIDLPKIKEILSTHKNSLDPNNNNEIKKFQSLENLTERQQEIVSDILSGQADLLRTIQRQQESIEDFQNTLTRQNSLIYENFDRSLKNTNFYDNKAKTVTVGKYYAETFRQFYERERDNDSNIGRILNGLNSFRKGFKGQSGFLGMLKGTGKGMGGLAASIGDDIHRSLLKSDNGFGKFLGGAISLGRVTASIIANNRRRKTVENNADDKEKNIRLNESNVRFAEEIARSLYGDNRSIEKVLSDNRPTNGSLIDILSPLSEIGTLEKSDIFKIDKLYEDANELGHDIRELTTSARKAYDSLNLKSKIEETKQIEQKQEKQQETIREENTSSIIPVSNQLPVEPENHSPIKNVLNEQNAVESIKQISTNTAHTSNSTSILVSLFENLINSSRERAETEKNEVYDEMGLDNFERTIANITATFVPVLTKLYPQLDKIINSLRNIYFDGMESARKLQESGEVKFASGGIVKSAVRGLVGEAGPEAIVPLKKNPIKNFFGGIAESLVPQKNKKTSAEFESEQKTNESVQSLPEKLETIIELLLDEKKDRKRTKKNGILSFLMKFLPGLLAPLAFLGKIKSFFTRLPLTLAGLLGKGAWKWIIKPITSFVASSAGNLFKFIGKTKIGQAATKMLSPALKGVGNLVKTITSPIARVFSSKAGSTAINAAKGAASIAGVGMAKGGLKGAARLISKANPIVTGAMALWDAADAYNDTDLHKRMFNLKEGEEASTLQKLQASASGALSGLTLGFISPETIHSLSGKLSDILFGSFDDIGKEFSDGNYIKGTFKLLDKINPIRIIGNILGSVWNQILKEFPDFGKWIDEHNPLKWIEEKFKLIGEWFDEIDIIGSIREFLPSWAGGFSNEELKARRNEKLLKANTNEKLLEMAKKENNQGNFESDEAYAKRLQQQVLNLKQEQAKAKTQTPEDIKKEISKAELEAKVRAEVVSKIGPMDEDESFEDYNQRIQDEIDRKLKEIAESLPKAASGGIVQSETAAIIGEAGTEAIIPLDEYYEKQNSLETNRIIRENEESRKMDERFQPVNEMAQKALEFFKETAEKLKEIDKTNKKALIDSATNNQDNSASNVPGTPGNNNSVPRTAPSTPGQQHPTFDNGGKNTSLNYAGNNSGLANPNTIVKDAEWKFAGKGGNSGGKVTEDVKSAIVSAAQKYGINPSLMASMANSEAGLRANAINREKPGDPNSAMGLFQFVGSTRRGLERQNPGLIKNTSDWLDPRINSEMAAKQMAENARILQKKGHDVNAENMYAMWHIGPAAAKMLDEAKKNPNASAEEIIKKIQGEKHYNNMMQYESNRRLVGGKTISEYFAGMGQKMRQNEVRIGDWSLSGKSARNGQITPIPSNLPNPTQGAVIPTDNSLVPAAGTRGRGRIINGRGYNDGSFGKDEVARFGKTGNILIDNARQVLANSSGNYVLGAKGQNGNFDCTGFVNQTLKYSKLPPQLTQELAMNNANGWGAVLEKWGFQKIPYNRKDTSNLQPGDILWKSGKQHGHVEMFAGQGRVIGAHSTSSGISERNADIGGTDFTWAYRMPAALQNGMQTQNDMQQQKQQSATIPEGLPQPAANDTMQQEPLAQSGIENPIAQNGQSMQSQLADTSATQNPIMSSGAIQDTAQAGMNAQTSAYYANGAGQTGNVNVSNVNNGGGIKDKISAMFSSVMDPMGWATLQGSAVH